MSQNKTCLAGAAALLILQTGLSPAHGQFSKSGTVPSSSSGSSQSMFSQGGRVPAPSAQRGAGGNMSGGCPQSNRNSQSQAESEAQARAQAQARAREEQEQLERQRTRFYLIEQQKAITDAVNNRAKEGVGTDVELPPATYVVPVEIKPVPPAELVLKHRLSLQLVDDKDCIITPDNPVELKLSGAPAQVDTSVSTKELFTEPWSEWSKELSANLFSTLKNSALSSSGKAEIAITINSSGSISPELLVSSGNLSFDQTILNSMLRLSFSPGLKFPPSSKWSKLRFLVTCEVSPTIAEGFDWPKINVAPQKTELNKPFF